MANSWTDKLNTGCWTVLGPYIVTPKGERKWLCRCDCGTERYVLERSLRYGGSKSCGCETRRKAKEVNSYDLKGKIIDELTVLSVAEDHKKDKRGGVWWRCRCSCGNEIDVLASLLVTGRKTHCGCKADPKYHTVDIRNRQFDRLTAKYPLNERDSKGGVIWHCVCECGNEVDLSYNTLMYSDIRSCGCWKRERESKLSDLLTRVAGTSLDMIKSKKIPADNTSGVKGVYYQRGKWIAKIVFQKRQYHLGKYDHIEDAAQARKEAEEILFDGMTSFYEMWRIKADTDPEWALENPIEVSVDRNADGGLVLICSPTEI